MGDCRMCAERDATIDGTVCGFPDGVFIADNWNCATLNALRGMTSAEAAYSEDQGCDVLSTVDGTFIVLGWYKHRHRTEYAGLLDESRVTPLTVDVAEGVIGRGEGWSRTMPDTAPGQGGRHPRKWRR